MKKNFKTVILAIFVVFALNLHAYSAQQVEPLELIKAPAAFLDKEIQIQGHFDKFSTLGLDYEKAFKSSKDYISILIERPGLPDDYTIPLSELKLFLKREEAEKMLDLENGDKIKITGKVFSAALNDPWVEIYELQNLDPEKKDKDLEE